MRKETRVKDSRSASMTAKTDNTPMSLELSEGQLEAHFRRLNLANTRRIYKDVAERAEKENWSYRDFLALLLAEEVARRTQTRLQRCTRNAHFPFFKTIEEFDFTLLSTLRQSVIGSYLGLDFVTEGRSLILHGKTGRGKTHLAVAIGYRAIQNGFETRFTTAAELIEDLSNASKKGNLQESLTTYTRPHVLVIDEVGYLTYGPDAANVLFHVVNDRHLRKRPMIFTTNKPLNEWGKVLHDEDMAAAILDRVLERGRFIHLDGPSGRTRHLNLEENLLPKAERLRISGISGSEFPEPTPKKVNATRKAKRKRSKAHKSALVRGLEALNEFFDTGPVPVAFFEKIVTLRDSVIHGDSQAEWKHNGKLRVVAYEYRSTMGADLSEEQLQEAIQKAIQQVKWYDEKMRAKA